MAINVVVLGRSGTGKSTLINALVSPGLPILPQGGLGPLTAAPVELEFSEEPYLVARYHRRTDVLALERVARTARSDAAVSIRAARLLLYGDQFGTAELGDLLAGLAAAAGHCEPKPTFSGLVRHRIERIRRALEIADSPDGSAVFYASQDLPRFLSETFDHAAGFLAPITRSLRIGWPTPLLQRGMTLVDLPGVGVANDIYGNTTHAWLECASHVLLVVGREGITEEARKALLTTGVARRLIVGAAKMVVVATQLDASATDARRRDTIRLQRIPNPWPQYFERIRARAIHFVTDQVRSVLRDALRPTDGADLTPALANVHIHAVSALEHQLFFRNDPDNPPKIDHPFQSGVPAVERTLTQLVAEANRR